MKYKWLLLIFLFTFCKKESYLYKQEKLSDLAQKAITITLHHVSATLEGNIVNIEIKNLTAFDLEIENPHYWPNTSYRLSTQLGQEIPYYYKINLNNRLQKTKIFLKKGSIHSTSINVPMESWYNFNQEELKNRKLLLYASYNGSIFKDGKLYGKGNIQSNVVYFEY